MSRCYLDTITLPYLQQQALTTPIESAAQPTSYHTFHAVSQQLRAARRLDHQRPAAATSTGMPTTNIAPSLHFRNMLGPTAKSGSPSLVSQGGGDESCPSMACLGPDLRAYHLRTLFSIPARWFIVPFPNILQATDRSATVSVRQNRSGR
jgi:hypothetical protein